MEKVVMDTLALTQKIQELTKDLFFDDMGSEGSEPVEAFYAEAGLKELTPATFSSFLELQEADPADEIAHFETATAVLETFVNYHQPFGLAEQAYQLVELLETHLKDLHIIILGAPNHPDVPSKHITYVLGLGSDGDLAGFTTRVIWT